MTEAVFQKKRKARRDTGYDIPIQTAKRIAKESGVKRIGEEAIFALISDAEEHMKQVIKYAIEYTKSAKRDTTSAEDIEKAKKAIRGL